MSCEVVEKRRSPGLVRGFFFSLMSILAVWGKLVRHVAGENNSIFYNGLRAFAEEWGLDIFGATLGCRQIEAAEKSLATRKTYLKGQVESEDSNLTFSKSATLGQEGIPQGKPKA